MEAHKTLGQLLPDAGIEGRDAIHVAILPVIASEILTPGAKLCFVYGSTEMVRRSEDNPIGIADPFIKSWHIPKGSRFWMFLFPGTIQGLRHHWHLDVIDNPIAPGSPSEVWLRQFAERWRMDYQSMIEGAQQPEGYITAQGTDLYSKEELGEDYELFWQHLEQLTGKRYTPEHRQSIAWSCSC